jgi:hypothetical protein
MGGWLVAYNTGNEQLQVETYFTGKGGIRHFIPGCHMHLA